MRRRDAPRDAGALGREDVRPLDVAPLRSHPHDVEKRTPHYALDSIKVTFTTVASLRMTTTARNSAFALGLVGTDVVRIIQGMTREQFYKSMTSLADHRV